MTDELRALLQNAIDHDDGAEINPLNYNHDDVCRLNGHYVQLVLAINEAIALFPAAGDADGAVERIRRGLEAGRKLGEHCELNPTAYVREINEALAALPALSQQTHNSNHLDIKDRENKNRATRDVLAERQRQIAREGWTTEHDDEHDRGELAQAAACYASPKPIYLFNRDYEDGMTGQMLFEGAWPWDSAWWKPQHRRRDLVKAGALILAEIERLDRSALPTAPKQEG